MVLETADMCRVPTLDKLYGLTTRREERISNNNKTTLGVALREAYSNGRDTKIGKRSHDYWSYVIGGHISPNDSVCMYIRDGKHTRLFALSHI